MGWFDKPKAERQADMNRYRSARRAANTGTRKFSRDESPTTKELNDAVIEAEKEVPRWLRW